MPDGRARWLPTTRASWSSLSCVIPSPLGRGEGGVRRTELVTCFWPTEYGNILLWLDLIWSNQLLWFDHKNVWLLSLSPSRRACFPGASRTVGDARLLRRWQRSPARGQLGTETAVRQLSRNCVLPVTTWAWRRVPSQSNLQMRPQPWPTPRL